MPENDFDVYDLAALAYLYKRVKEIELVREASHVVIDEAQDFGMMVYSVLKFCMRNCTFTIMGDVSQNIHYGYGLNDWEALRKLFLTGPYDSFELLRKSYRNTIEISNFAMRILQHGNFPIYPVEPIIRHGKDVTMAQLSDDKELYRYTAEQVKHWQKEGLETIAIVCRDEKEAEKTAKKMMKGNFDLEDFLNQLNQIKKLGPLENLLKLLPGAKKMGLNNVNIDPKIMKRTEAIVLSMTLEERRDPSILKASRKKRIADGSGTTVTDVNKLLNQFEEMKKMMKMMGNGNFKMPF